MPTDLVTQISPFLTKTTAIMTAAILLIIISAILVSIERKVNRGTVEKLLNLNRFVICLLIALEVYLSSPVILRKLLKLYIIFKGA